ncbi:MAG: T9SS type A sorting domain-containing protein, partial [Flavobacteriales bacterium]
RQVDRDGAEEITQTVVAFMGQGGDLRPVIFPNPATDVLNVAFNTPLDGSAVLYVQDALGRMVTQSSVIVLRGERTAVIPTSGLANGWYNLRIAMPDGTMQQGGSFLKK